MTMGKTSALSLEAIGWTPAWRNAFAATGGPGCIPARILREDRGLYGIVSEAGESLAEISGRFRYNAQQKQDFPAVGDWVVTEQPDGASHSIIHGVLPRTSAFIRRAAGRKREGQVVAANVDVVFLVSGLDHDFKPRRIERYLTLAYESGADPVVVLNKADLCDDPAGARPEAQAVAYGVPTLLLSAATGQGLDDLRNFLAQGTTGALLGSSGVGKTSLINALLGEEALATAAVREGDSRGRHTTTHRQLIPLPGGAALIDTPGMRELQLLGNDASLAQSFDEIADLSRRCRFSDCSHTREPGCAVKEALTGGQLDAARYESYLRQRKEMQHQQREHDIHLKNQEKRRWQAIHRSMRFHHKRKQSD